MPLDLACATVNKISLKELLNIIDNESVIIIKKGSDIIYRGKCGYLVPTYLFQNIHVLNILTDYQDNRIIICVDSYFE